MNHALIAAIKLAYRSGGYLGALAFGPASEVDIATAEERLGFALPPLLRVLYREVGDGGFGPCDGAIALRAEYDKANMSIASTYELMRLRSIEDRHWRWPRYLLPLVDWGCAVKSCVDCEREPYPIIRFDPNGHVPGSAWTSAFSLESASLDAWFTTWAKRIGLKIDEG